VPRVDYEKLSSAPWQDFILQGLRWLGELSAAVRKRVEAARERQRARFAEISLVTNADSAQPPRQGDGSGRDAPACALWVFYRVDEAAKSLLKVATPALGPQVQVCSRCI
jgi:hypothetical protein